MLDPDTADGQRFEQVVLACLREILRHQDAARFLDWARETIPSALGLGEHGLAPEEMERLAVLLATAVWNITPLPSAGFRPQPLTGPAGEGRCPCGSGRAFRECCAGLIEPPELPPDLMWELLLEELPERQLQQAVTAGAVPAHLLGAVADRWLDEDRPGRAVSLLEPLFATEGAELDERFDPALNVLCDAYDRLDHWKKKRDFLERMTERGGPGFRAAAWQRLATVHIDGGDFDAARSAFTRALRLAPESPATALLEITLLAAQHEDGLARERAKFWRRKLARRGFEDEEVMDFLARAASDPQEALVASHADLIDPLLLRLRDWVRQTAVRPLPVYRLEPLRSPPGGAGTAQLTLFDDADAAGAAAYDGTCRMARLRAPAALRRLEGQWSQAFPGLKPLSTRLSPPLAEDPWDDDGWVGFLAAHPQAADSLEVLDDLATALYIHPESNLPWIAGALLAPLLGRALAIVERALGDSPRTAIPWAAVDNRPALRLLFRRYLFEDGRGAEDTADAALESLLRLNPDDNHGLRAELINRYLRRGEDEKALELAGRFPDDLLADLAYGEVLALYRLGRREKAARALSQAVGRLPRIPHYLTRKRVRQPPLSPSGVTPGGDDQAWLYREAMRDVWAAEPGVLAWLRKHTA